MLSWGELNPPKEEIDKGVEAWGSLVERRRMGRKFGDVTCNVIARI
jgi:hypothetical protein